MSHNRFVLMFTGSKLVESFRSGKNFIRKDGKIIISLIMCQKKCLTLHFVRQKETLCCVRTQAPWRPEIIE